MSSGVLLALVIFASGLALLIVWLARTWSNPRLGIMLRKSVVFFLLPGALMVVVPLFLPIGPMTPSSLFGILLVAMFFEEVLKMSAARSEALVRNKFALAMLFGIYELMLAKPLLPFADPMMALAFTQWGIIDLVLRGSLAVLMHTVTAALYATRFAERPWLGLLICFGIHTVYNFMVLMFPNIAMVALLAIVLGIILAVNWPEAEPEWEWEAAEPEAEPA